MKGSSAPLEPGEKTAGIWDILSGGVEKAKSLGEEAIGGLAATQVTPEEFKSELLTRLLSADKNQLAGAALGGGGAAGGTDMASGAARGIGEGITNTLMQNPKMLWSKFKFPLGPGMLQGLMQGFGAGGGPGGLVEGLKGGWSGFQGAGGFGGTLRGLQWE